MMFSDQFVDSDGLILAAALTTAENSYHFVQSHCLKHLEKLIMLHKPSNDSLKLVEAMNKKQEMRRFKEKAKYRGKYI
jgi:hypothetical protein